MIATWKWRRRWDCGEEKARVVKKGEMSRRVKGGGGGTEEADGGKG